jgi:uncharacterized protein
LSIPHQDARFRTSDGLVLSGWHVPSQNGAAIVIVHGGGGDRTGERTHAAMLARAGYGVLMYDARGRGQSQGAPDAYGWTWGRDVDAAITWLEQRPDVKDGRIGPFGLSVGADVLIEVVARRRDIRAVVDDGATTRSVNDAEKVIHGGGLLSIPSGGTNTPPLKPSRTPPPDHLSRHSLPTCTRGSCSSPPTGASSGPHRRSTHELPSSPATCGKSTPGTQGLHDHPRQYTQHVLSFFASALLHQR